MKKLIKFTFVAVLLIELASCSSSHYPQVATHRKHHKSLTSKGDWGCGARKASRSMTAWWEMR